MKKVLFLMASVFMLSSCKLNVSEWGLNKIDPSDNVVTKAYKVPAFEQVTMSWVGQVELIQDEKKSGTIELTAPENYQELYKFESEDGRLNIGSARNSINIQTRNVKIKVYTADLTRIQNCGAASINMDSLDTDHLDIINSGVGQISVVGIADDVNLQNSGVGSIEADKLKALNVKANVSGVGSISCYASEKIEGNVSGVGSLDFAGHPKQKNNHRSGVGSINEL
jgi:hypothetical protein